ncbi:MAG: hypothetical protein QM723_16955 [Myxococcaceae bacterium]
MSPAATPCPRCGTFAPLAVSEWRSLCQPCMELTRGALEEAKPTFGGIFETTFRAMRATWWATLPIVLLIYLPREAIMWNWDVPVYGLVAYSVLAGSIAEAFSIRFAANRLLGGAAGHRVAWRQTLPRLLPMMLVNLVEQISATVMLCTCIGAPIAGGILLPAIPIVLLEKTGPLDTLRDSWRRTKPHWLRLALVMLVLLLAEILIGWPASFIKHGRIHAPEMVGVVLRVVAAAIEVLVLRPISFQVELAAWAATFPRPHHTFPPQIELQPTAR